MPTLSIEGLGDVEVGEEFVKLSPADQKKTVDEIEHALRVKKRAGSLAGSAPDAIARGLGVNDEIAGLAAAAKPFAQRLASGDLTALNVFNPFKDAGGDITQAYERGRDVEAGRTAEYRKANPPGRIRVGDKSYAAAYGSGGAAGEELMGGLIAGGPARGAAAAVATSRAGKAFEALPAWMQNTAQGAAWGAGTGALNADPGSRTQGAIIGGSLGAAIPAAGHAVAKGAELANATVGGYLRARANPEKQALRVLKTNLDYDDVGLDEALRRLKELGPKGTLADVADENVMGLARGAAGTPGSAKRRIMDTFTERAKGEANRLSPFITKKLGPGDYLASQDDFVSSLSKNATRVYRPAYDAHKSIPTTDGLKSFLMQPEAKPGLAEAASIARHRILRGEDVSPSLGDDLGKLSKYLKNPKGDPPSVSLEAWDYVKQGFDGILGSEKYTNPLTGRLTRMGRELAKTKTWLMDQLDNLTGGKMGPYAVARSQYGGDAEILTALREGSNVRNKSVELIKRDLAGMSDAAKEAYRNGAARYYMEDILQRTPDTSSIATKLDSTPLAREKLRALFPTETDFNAFKRVLDREMRFARTRNFIGTGSRTAPMTEDITSLKQAAGSIGALLGSELPFGHALIAGGTGRRIAQALFADNTKQFNEEIARMLTTSNRAEQMQILDGLRKIGTSPVGKKLSPEAQRALQLVITGGGQAAGRAQ